MGTFALYLLGNARTVDASGNGHTLTEILPVKRSAGLNGIASRGGRMVGAGADFRTAGAIDISAYVNLDGSSGDRWLCACEKSGANGQTWWKCGFRADGALYWGYDYTGGHQDIAADPGVVPGSGWTHVRFVRESDERTVRFYVQQVEIAMAQQTNVASGGSASELIVMNDAYNLGTHRIQQLQISVA